MTSPHPFVPDGDVVAEAANHSFKTNRFIQSAGTVAPELPWNPQGFRVRSRGTLRIVFNFFFPANMLKIHEHIFVIR